MAEKRLHGKKVGVIKAAVLNWLDIPIDAQNAEFWGSWYGTDKAGVTVNEKNIMGLSAAWACTRLISESIATLPFHVYEKTPSGRRLAPEYFLYNIVHSTPNYETCAVTFWQSLVAGLLLRGNTYCERQEIGNRLVGLKFLSPDRSALEKSSTGLFQIRYRNDNGTERIIPYEKIWHVPGFTLDGRFGVSVISYGSGVFASALAAQEAANSTFEKGLSPTVAFTIDKVVQKDKRDEFREYVKTISGAINAGESPLIEKGMDAKVIGIPPKDAQLLESRLFSVEEVCRWFRVDPSLVGHGGKDSNFGTGLEQKMIGFLTNTLRCWITILEQYINYRLIPVGDRNRFYCELSIEGLLRADSKTRADFLSVMVNNGIYTRDEARALENRDLMGGNASKLTVQSAMTTLDSLGSNAP